jgi:hypothetical protein
MVRIVRTDRSLTFKGPYRSQRAADYELAAWRSSFPAYDSRCVPTSEVRGEMREWRRQVRMGRRYYLGTAGLTASRFPVSA